MIWFSERSRATETRECFRCGVHSLAVRDLIYFDLLFRVSAYSTRKRLFPQIRTNLRLSPHTLGCHVRFSMSISRFRDCHPLTSNCLCTYDTFANCKVLAYWRQSHRNIILAFCPLWIMKHIPLSQALRNRTTFRMGLDKSTKADQCASPRWPTNVGPCSAIFGIHRKSEEDTSAAVLLTYQHSQR